MASLSSSGGAGFLSWGFAQRKFELRPKNTAKFYIQHNEKRQTTGELSWDSVIKNFLITAFNREMKMILKLNRGKATKGKPDSSMFGTQ